MASANWGGIETRTIIATGQSSITKEQGCKRVTIFARSDADYSQILRIRSLGKFAHPPLPDSQFGFAVEPLIINESVW